MTFEQLSQYRPSEFETSWSRASALLQTFNGAEAAPNFSKGGNVNILLIQVVQDAIQM